MPFGLLYFFESGTNDDKTTFADVNETIENTQPLILNGDGSVPNCFYSGSAKVQLVLNVGTPTAPIKGTQQWERDPVTSASIGAIGRQWDAVSIYDKNSVVILDDIFYVSIINANQNNNPSSTPTAWTQFDLLKRFNINETYQLADPVIGSDGFLYTSLIINNTGNDPTSTTGFWTLPTVGTVENLLIGNFRINQRGVSGTVVLTAGNYGHDRFRAGSGGCTYTFATSNNVTTITISVGTLEQEIEGTNIFSGIHVLSWDGTAQGQIDGGGFANSGVTATLTGGTNAIIEFDDGTISLPNLNPGSSPVASDRLIGDELAMCQRYFQRIIDFTASVELGVGQCRDTTLAGVNVSLPVTMRAIPTIQFNNINSFATTDKDGVEITLTSMTIAGSNDPSRIRLNTVVASGLVAGNATVVRSLTTAAFLDFRAEL